MQKPAAQIQLPAEIALLNWSVETEDVILRRAGSDIGVWLMKKASVRLQSTVSTGVAGRPA